MNLQQFIEGRAKRKLAEPSLPTHCFQCRQKAMNCYCLELSPIDPKIQFVILIHPIESRRRIATGRMTHLSLKNSLLLEGEDFSKDPKLNEILSHPQNHCVILYPGPKSTDLSPLSLMDRERLFPENKNLVVIVIDGTWSKARAMMRLSHNLHSLPQIHFLPPKASRFRIRKQPKELCYSTVEAVHHTIDLLGPSRGFDVSLRGHDQMLKIFESMVERQLQFIQGSNVTNL